MTAGNGPQDNTGYDGGDGYGRPPRANRFVKGQSGNPAGRPPARHRKAPYSAVLAQLVTIRESGVERQVTAAVAFVLQLTKRGLEGDDAAARVALAMIEQASERQDAGQPGISAIVHVMVAPGSVTSALALLRMARKLDPHRETARIVLEPWVVEAALARLNGKLSPVDQRTVMTATRTPHKVKWPDWWSEPP